jgi:uncharacterized protein YjdB
MKKHILIYALSALTVFGLGSCVKPVEETLPTGDGARTVTFTAELGGQTRTGLQMKFVPNWVNTDLANVHLFETVGGLTDEGDNVTMTIEEGTNNEVAHFTAQFGTETELFVTPPTRADGDAAYTAIVASRADGKYVVPATQTPDPVSLFDPDADFLVAEGTLVEATETGKQVDLTFLRPVAVSRLAIMNIEGQSIKSVKITSTDKLTGSVAYEGIDFAAGTASFDAESGSEELTLSYGDGIAVDATSTFYAYFISLPGSKNITAVEVTTNRYVYTKTFGTGKTLNFNTTDFKNIAVDMSKVTPTQAQEISFGKETLSGMVGRRITPPALSGNHTAPAYSSDNTAVATVDVETGVLTLVAPGTAVITATAPAGSGYGPGTASYTLTVVAAPLLDAHHYQKVTSISTVTDAKRYLFVYDNGASSKIFMPILNATQDAFLQTDNALDAVVVNGNVIAGNSEIDLYQVAFANIGSGGKMAVSALNALGDTPYYFMIFGLESTDTQQDINEFAGHPSDNGFRATFSIDENGVLSAARSSHYFVYQGGAFQHASSADANSKLALYEFVSGLVPQTLEFSSATLTGSVGKTVTPPTLSGAYTTVTYSSDTPSVATVNSTTGALTLVAEGTATITATAAAENGYDSASASYTVTVNAAPPVTPHYYQKVTSLDGINTTNKYLFVYEDGASSKVFRPVLNSDKNAFEQSNNTVNATLWAGSWLAYDADIDACQFSFDNINGAKAAVKFLYADGDTPYYFMVFGLESNGSAGGQQQDINEFAAHPTDNGFRATFAISNGVLSATRSNRYLVFEDGAFKCSQTNPGTAAKLALYQYVEGATAPTASGTYVKVNAASELTTNTAAAQGDYIFVYEDGDVAHVFKPIVATAPTGDGTQPNNHSELTKDGSTIVVPLTSSGIAAYDAVIACKIQLQMHETKQNTWNIYAVDAGWWLRLDSSNKRLVAMTSKGYGSLFTFAGTGNNLTLSRDNNTYLVYNASVPCFEASATSANISMYKLSE